MTADEIAKAHRYFAADCFNRAWSLIDLAERTAEQDQQMELLALASLWHWTQRADCTARERSIGYWQASRVYALLGNAPDAVRYAELCLACSGQLPPFFPGYAHEARARAAHVAGDAGARAAHLASARQCAGRIESTDDRAALEADLGTIESVGGRV